MRVRALELVWLLCNLCATGLAAAQTVTLAGNNYDAHDLYGLEQLYGGWGIRTPDMQHNLAGWNGNITSYPPCAQTSPWKGVFCNAKPLSQYGRDVWNFEIVGLTLRNASIVGTLPPAIGNLTNLVTLTLTGNPGLTGPLPTELGLLLSLFDIDLHGNGFTGTIPQFFLQSFGFLQSLDLSGNQLTGLLPGNLSQDVASYRTLQTMNMSHNLFSGPIAPDFFMYLQNLVSADLSFNNLTGGLPAMTYPNKTKLLDLDLSNNMFTGSLPIMSGHPTIRLFNVSGNLLSGELDATLISNISLTTLDLSRNNFSGPIPNLSLLTRLKHLDLSYNNFRPDSFPVWAKNLKNLRTLTLRGISLNGVVPPTILGGFESLETINLDDNSMRGTLDINSILAVQNIGMHLQQISLSNNKISGVIYSDHVNNLHIKFNLSGNPYCDLKSNPDNDLRRCVCQQQCFYTGNIASNKKTILITLVVTILTSLLVVVIFSFFFCRSRRVQKKLICEANQKFAEYEVKPTLYTYSEIRLITEDFHPEMKLGEGHYGAVYKGILANGTQVAVKQLFTRSQQNLDVFLNEIVLVAAVKHRNLVKLKGCCIRKDQRLLVHEFVESGDLEQVLFEKNPRKGNMTWSVRKNICLGVAHGIHYLHSLAQPRIIHRDIKASNILLDKNLEPKIADFGLALLFPDDKSHIMTVHIAGTRGYLAPEYATLGQLSEKVDVYSFGVLVFEIVSGRKNIDSKQPEDMVYLLDWAWRLRDEEKLAHLVDESLSLQIDEEMEVQRFLQIAFLCVHATADKRPNMSRVVAMLQGDMDYEIAELTRLRAQSRIDNRFDSLMGPPGCSESRGLPSSTTASLYRNSPTFVSSSVSGSRDGLLSSLGIEMPDPEWTR